MIRFQKSYGANSLTESLKLADFLRIFLIVAFVFKTIDVVHLIVQQSSADIFFMDWERSKSGLQIDAKIFLNQH